MRNPWLPFFALLHLSSLKASASIGIGIGGGGGGVGVWINGRGITTTTTPPNLNPPPTSSDPSPSREYTALQAWKSAITEDPNGILTTWVGADVCNYRGVFCSDPPEATSYPSTAIVVRGIDLNHANVKGALVDDLSLLTHLSILHLNTNRFSGTVPDSFTELRFLTELDLSNNLLSGPFPTTTLLIPSLIYLDLRFNGLSGELPDELFESNLDAIFLNNNQFDGQIPMSLWASPASVVTLANNRLSGSVPAGFGFMGSGIRELLLLNNRLTGCVPEGVGYLPEVEVLDLSYNSLTGHLPGSLSCLPGVEVLNIAHNQLSGELPDLCGIRSLANLSVAFNFFSGFDEDCAKLVFRNVGFDFSGNCIPGSDMQRPPPECMGVPGGGLSCLRIPSTRPAVCSSGMALGQAAGYRGRGYALPASAPGSVP